MTDEELEAIDDMHPNDYVHQLVAEVRRLRGLLERMDDRNEGLYAYGIRHCPWCSWMNDGPGFTQMGMAEHSPRCPAFTPEGAVK